MTDTYQPQFGTPDYYTPQGVPGIRVGRGPKPADEWEGYGSDKPPEKKAAAPTVADDWEKYGANQPPTPKEQPQVTPMQAFGAGLKNVFGAGPAIAGLAEASGIPEPDLYASSDNPIEPAKAAATYVARPFVGLAKIAHNWITGNEDPATVNAYNAGRQSSLDYNDAAFKQDPKAYLLGQLTQAVAMPLSGAGAAAQGAGAFTRALGAARAGAIGGGLYGAGEGVSEGQGVEGVAANTALGAGIGAAGGTALQGLFEGVGNIGGNVARFIRGREAPEAQARRQIVEAFGADRANPRTPQITPQQATIARATGMPVVAADVGGPAVQELADWAATHSPDAKWTLSQFAQQRFEQQNTRMSALMRAVQGRAADMEALKRQARAVTKPLYDRAYAAGNKMPLTPELRRLSTSDDVQRAINSAKKNWRSWQVADGYDAKAAAGGDKLRFWDLVHREMSSEIGTAVRNGDNETARRLIGQHNDLMAELDNIVPEFANARQAHATFKRGEKAYETGQDWVAGNMDMREARRYLASLSPAERELLAHGFAQSFIDKVESVADRQTVLNRINQNPRAREAMRMALGARRADIIESGLRLEEIVDRLRAAGGNSRTAERLASGEHVGSAVGAVEALKDAGVGAVGIITSTLGASAIRKEAAAVDRRVATELADMLLSGNADQFSAAVRRISASRVMREAVRRFGEAGTRTAVGNVGPGNIAAAGAAYVTHKEEPGHHPPNEDLLPGPGSMQ